MHRMFILAASIWMQAQAGALPAQGTPQAGMPSPRPDSARMGPTLSLTEAAKRFGVTVTASPETVTIGQHFKVTVRVHVPEALKSQIQFPDGVDTLTQNAATSNTSTISTGERHDQTSGGFVDATQTYELAAWDIGQVQLGLADMYIGKTPITLSTPTVFVRSILPKDAQARLNAQPKAPRSIFHLSVIVRHILLRAVQQHKLLSLIIAILVIGLIALLVMRRRARKKNREAALIDWAKWAHHEFERIEAMHLLEKGEHELHAILMTNVLRESLIHQFPAVRASATTREMTAVLQRESLIPSDRILSLFQRVDMFKFAGLESELAEAQTIGHEDIAIVDEIEVRRQAELAARLAAEAAAAEAKKKGAA